MMIEFKIAIISFVLLIVSAHVTNSFNVNPFKTTLEEEIGAAVTIILFVLCVVSFIIGIINL